MPTWCSRRPLTAALLTSAGGLTIVFLPSGRYTVLLLPGLAGVTGFVLGGLLAICGLFLCLSPLLHAPLGVAAALLSVTALITTNIGGFLLGTLLGIVGGSLAFAWSPRPGQYRFSAYDGP